jgi:DNA-binding MarR family transcriptional regulator
MRNAVDGHMGVVTALVRSSFLVHGVYAEAAREHGLTYQQGQLLCVLMAQPYGMNELGGILGLANSSLTGLVDRSTRRGLVRREPDPSDRRAIRVALTAEGSSCAEAFYADACQRIEALPTGLSDADRRTLTELLARVVSDNKVPAVFMEFDGGVPATGLTNSDSPTAARSA